ncbi:hypothetical protein ACQEVB_13140 [Pseudonocardia sp. CA-107938]|uniref:hypothetical protein n=1 Tax=Pseudonocardia sp. CA-107938 TaxID=3240021 RepID=UPI003D8FEE27
MDVLQAVARELVPHPEAWARLIELHVADQDGRCRGCRSQLRAAERWPCALHLVATTARDLARPDQLREAPRSPP